MPVTLRRFNLWAVTLTILGGGAFLGAGHFGLFGQRHLTNGPTVARNLHGCYMSCYMDRLQVAGGDVASVGEITVERLLLEGYIDSYHLEQLKPFIVVFYPRNDAAPDKTLFEFIEPRRGYTVTCALSGEVTARNHVSR
jgi:hypothetical protein